MAIVSDYYDIKYTKEIGRGASGKVYLAARIPDGLKTAVKVISRATLNHENLRAILNEIRTLQELDHPHIVRLYDMFEDKKNFYLAMEYIQGGELFDRITRKTYYSEKDARELCKIILSAIIHLHSRDIVHRDLKPENLLLNQLDDDTDIKIVDFGFCEYVKDGRKLKGTLGTPMYMAPEIWCGDSYGKPIDMWSFGVITYILLAGYPPFSEEKREKLINHIKSGIFVFHTQYWKEVSEEAKDFISKLLIVDPQMRMTAEDCMHHPWLTKIELEGAQHLSDAITNLKDFNARRRLKSAFSAVVAVNRMNKLLNMSRSNKSASSNNDDTNSVSSPVDNDNDNNSNKITTSHLPTNSTTSDDNNNNKIDSNNTSIDTQIKTNKSSKSHDLTLDLEQVNVEVLSDLILKYSARSSSSLSSFPPNPSLTYDGHGSVNKSNSSSPRIDTTMSSSSSQAKQVNTLSTRNIREITCNGSRSPLSLESHLQKNTLNYSDCSAIGTENIDNKKNKINTSQTHPSISLESDTKKSQDMEVDSRRDTRSQSKSQTTSFMNPSTWHNVEDNNNPLNRCHLS